MAIFRTKKTGTLKAYIVTTGFEYGDAESGPVVDTDAHLVYAQAQDEAESFIREKYQDEEAFAGCFAIPATKEQEEELKEIQTELEKEEEGQGGGSFFSDLARNLFKRAQDAGLGEYYQPEMGNIIISDDEMGVLNLTAARDYLAQYPDSVMGHEENYYFITRIEDLE